MHVQVFDELCRTWSVVLDVKLKKLPRQTTEEIDGRCLRVLEEVVYDLEILVRFNFSQ